MGLKEFVYYLPIERFKKWLGSDYMSEEDEEEMVER
jgi:hypothetical protein